MSSIGITVKQDALGHIAGRIGNGRISMHGRVEPNLVTTCGLTVELKSEGFELLDDLAIAEPG
jgi:hypothetical protein